MLKHLRRTFLTEWTEESTSPFLSDAWLVKILPIPIKNQIEFRDGLDEDLELSLPNLIIKIIWSIKEFPRPVPDS